MRGSPLMRQLLSHRFGLSTGHGLTYFPMDLPITRHVRMRHSRFFSGLLLALAVFVVVIAPGVSAADDRGALLSEAPDPVPAGDLPVDGDDPSATGSPVFPVTRLVRARPTLSFAFFPVTGPGHARPFSRAPPQATAFYL
jgi:hypothetical protein